MQMLRKHVDASNKYIIHIFFSKCRQYVTSPLGIDIRHVHMGRPIVHHRFDIRWVECV